MADETVYLIKRMDFFGRSVPVFLQNINGPCPLLAIANVLSLRNQLKVDAGARQIMQEKLITLVADHLLECSKQYENLPQLAADFQQNISDCFEVLSKLTTGIDVNLKFHNIHAFEPTKEVAVFDLLGIPLVHGWLVDPQDAPTAAAFSNKSYNELVEMLFSTLGDAAVEQLSTTTSLPMRSISLNRTSESFTERGQGSRRGSQHDHASGSGQDSRGTPSPFPVAEVSAAGIPADGTGTTTALPLEQQAGTDKTIDLFALLGDLVPPATTQPRNQSASYPGEPRSHAGTSSSGLPAPIATSGNQAAPEGISNINAPPDAAGSHVTQSQSHVTPSADLAASISKLPTSADESVDQVVETVLNELVAELSNEAKPGSIALGDSPTRTKSLQRAAAYHTPGPSPLGQAASIPRNAIASNVDTAGVNQERSRAVTPAAYHTADANIVRHFLESYCSQLTPHGLVELHHGLKEHQLAVFFRNNHFNTMFKYEAGIYQLVTDQGYAAEPDIVWERLDSVDGNTTFCTSGFTGFVPHKAAAVQQPSDTYVQYDNAQPESGLHSQHDADFALALQLQLQEEEALAEQENAQRVQQQEQQQQGQQQQLQQQQQQQQQEYDLAAQAAAANQQQQSRAQSHSGSGRHGRRGRTSPQQYADPRPVVVAGTRQRVEQVRKGAEDKCSIM
eukprot:jgi/Chrzof1/13678/Cz08g07220.t1